ncbi:MAG: hypothetical protein K1X71_04625 [Pirellulales bacterium]|nr:hypothetical protein [Pirellulales bacterium]
MSDAPRPASSRHLRLICSATCGAWGVLVAAILLGLFTRWSYLAAPVALDDLDFFVQIGLVRTGRWPLGFFVLAPQGPHPMALWKLLYFGEWLAFGIDTAGYRVVMSIVHGLSSTLLFLLLRRYGAATVAAWCGALVFAGAAIGGWDNPLSWLMCGMIPLAILFFLAAMVCVTRLTGAHAGRWTLLLATATACSLLSWGNMVALLPAAPAQFFWLEHAPWNRQTRRRIGWGWLAPYLIFGAVQVAILIPQMGREERQRAFAPLDVAYRTVGQASVAAATLVYGQVLSPERQALGPKLLLAAIALPLALATASAGLWRLLLLLIGVVTINLLLVNFGGASVEFDSALSSGRYLYIPTLMWAVAAATIFDFGVRKGRVAPASAWPLAAVVVISLFAWHQRGVARETRAQFELVGRSTTLALEAQRRLLRGLDHRAAAARAPIPDLPVLLANPSHLLWTTSMFAAACDRGHTYDARIVPADSAAVIHPAIAVLRETSVPHATDWANLWEQAAPDFRAMAWLSRYAVQEKKVIRLPKFWFTHGAIRYPSDQLVAWGFAAPLANLQVTAELAPISAEWLSLAQELDMLDAPEARGWAALLRQLAAESRGAQRVDND